MFHSQKTLKQDAFGQIHKGIYYDGSGAAYPAIRRVYTQNIFLKPLALLLAGNEKRALRQLNVIQSTGYFPKLLEEDKTGHVRSFIEGASMHQCGRTIPSSYFKEAKTLVKCMRKQGVVNNDLAKEANWLITPDNKPAISDFQLALTFKHNQGKLCLAMAREDLRHMLKHKRTYKTVTTSEKSVLAKKAWVTQAWMQTGKRLHRFVTRKILGWKERTGPEERDF